MKEPDRVTYKVLVSTGDYSHIEVGVEINVGSRETTEAALGRARACVRARVKEDYRKMGDLRGWEDEAESSEPA